MVPESEPPVPQVEDTEAEYPVSGLTVKDVVLPEVTVCAVFGEMVPPVPALGVTVYEMRAVQETGATVHTALELVTVPLP